MSKKKINSRLVKNIISILCLPLLFFWLFQINWNDIASKTNSGAFFGVTAAILIIVSLQLKEKKPENDDEVENF